MNLFLPLSQLTFTCSNSAIETIEKDADYVQSLLTLNLFHIFFYCFYWWLGVNDVVLVFFIVKFEYISHLFSSASNTDFEGVNVCWVICVFTLNLNTFSTLTLSCIMTKIGQSLTNWPKFLKYGWLFFIITLERVNVTFSVKT